MKKNRHSFLERIMSLISIVPMCASILSQFTNLLETEAALAKRNLMLQLCGLIVLMVTLLSTWLSLNVLLFLYFISLQLTYVTAALFVFIINLFMLIFVSLLILNLQRKQYFPQTRHLLLRWRKD